MSAAAAAAPPSVPASAPPSAPASAPPAQSSLARQVTSRADPRTALELNAVTGRWDELITRVRGAGKALLAAALESSAPVAVTRAGDITIALDEPNDFHARAIEQARSDLVTLLGEWFDGVRDVRLHRDESRQAPAEKPARVTDEMVKSQRLTTLRRKDASLDAAIDILDLEIAE